nr:hypothetical protein CFP56_37818 [Quercus suber]
MEQRHSPCRDTSSWTDSNDFDEREREVADILVEFYHQLNEYARPQVSVWGAKRKRSVPDETYSPAQAATFPNNSEPLRVQPLRSVPSNSYTNTTMKINDECLRAQPLRTVIPSNDGLFSTGATNLVCHGEPNSLVLHLKPMKKPTNKKRHSPCRDTSSWTDSNDFDEREREVADILVEFYHQLNEYARPQVSVWGAKRKRSVPDETYSPAQAATFPNNSEPLRVQPLRSVPSNSYTNTTMKINDECLRAQPLRTVIPSNDGLFSTGATNLVCH